jgi:hypothetical protein
MKRAHLHLPLVVMAVGLLLGNSDSAQAKRGGHDGNPPAPSSPAPALSSPAPAPSSPAPAPSSPAPAPSSPAPLTLSGPIVIDGQSGTAIKGLHITSTSGDCVQIINSTNVTIEQSEIGPCGTNGTTNPSRGIYISGGTGNNVYDNYIHVENRASGCCDSHDGIQIDGSAYATIQGNVIAYGESNIEIDGAASDHITVTGNFLLNPRGPFPRGQNVQSWSASATSPNTNIIVSNNYTLSSTDTFVYLYPENQEDSLNFGFTNGIIALNNYVVGGHSPSGCGIIADEAANSAQFLNNILSNTGQCGIGIANGTNQTVTGNKILDLTPVSGGGNTAIYVWNQFQEACGPATIFNNVADELKPDGTTHSPYWNGGGCDTVTETNDTFGPDAYSLLYPMSTTNPPPPVPVIPQSCVAVSPYTTNASWSPCWTP